MAQLLARSPDGWSEGVPFHVSVLSRVLSFCWIRTISALRTVRRLLLLSWTCQVVGVAAWVFGSEKTLTTLAVLPSSSAVLLSIGNTICFWYDWAVLRAGH